MWLYTQSPPGLSDWSNGTTHCLPPPPDDDGWSPFEAFAEWVGAAWDYVAESYDWIQDKVVDVVLTFVPCEQIADEVTDDGKEVCRQIAKTALQAVMAAYGVPPEIPDWDTAVAAAKGDIRAYIMANAAGLQIAPLLPGETSSFELWLTKRSEWFEPDGYNDHYAKQWAMWNQSAGANHAWVLTQKGAVLEPWLSSACSKGPAFGKITLTGQVWE